jgi:hypothetical protein
VAGWVLGISSSTLFLLSFSYISSSLLRTYNPPCQQGLTVVVLGSSVVAVIAIVVVLVLYYRYNLSLIIIKIS